MEKNNIIDPKELSGENYSATQEPEEKNIRPAFIKEYIGQQKNVEKIKIFLEAAKIRKEALDHVLLAGPPGLGKTTLANIIAHEMGSHIHTLSGPTIEKKADLATILTQLEPYDVLFIDEIHRLHKAIEEVLYSAMEDFRLDIIIGQGPAARTLKIDLPPFTLVGATTRVGLLTNPLRDRFGVQLRLDFYPAHELKKIILRASTILGIELEDEAAKEMAERSRGTPRIANRILKRVRDYVQVRHNVKSSERIPSAYVKQALDFFEIDSRGLDLLDRKFLTQLIQKFLGGPVGIETMSAALGEEVGTLKDVYEPYLLQEGFMRRTPQGRVATLLAYEHLGLMAHYEGASKEL